jgi:hypothetical protein
MGGDLDNRMKTLVDGLTRPANRQQASRAQPKDEPTYCLMDDDSLLKRLGLDTRRWFEPGIQPDEAFVLISATMVLGDNADMTSPSANMFLLI